MLSTSLSMLRVDAGILDLQRQLAAVGGDGVVHLADRGGGDRVHAEGRESVAPTACRSCAPALGAAAPPACVALGAQDRQRLRHLRRQEVLPFERQQLPQLHRRAAHARQALGELAGVGGGEEDAVAAAAGAGEAARRFGDARRSPPRRPASRAARAARSGRPARATAGTAVCGLRGATRRAYARRARASAGAPMHTRRPATSTATRTWATLARRGRSVVMVRARWRAAALRAA